MNTKLAEETYTQADLERILKVPAKRLRALMDAGELLGPDMLVPGGGHKAARWTASRIAEIQKAWRHPAAA